MVTVTFLWLGLRSHSDCWSDGSWATRCASTSYSAGVDATTTRVSVIVSTDDQFDGVIVTTGLSVNDVEPV